eukprot:COSAG02_NODE_8641_length_2495_cov_1.913189_2_plen_65_part_00
MDDKFFIQELCSSVYTLNAPTRTISLEIPRQEPKTNTLCGSYVACVLLSLAAKQHVPQFSVLTL